MSNGKFTKKQKIPTIGLLPTDLKASEIHQWPTTETRGDSSEALGTAKLNEGMPLIYVHKDEKITWEPQFSLEFGTSAATTDELYVELGYGKFGDKNSNTKKIAFGADTRVKTNSKKGKLEFDVFVKEQAHKTTITKGQKYGFSES